LCFYLRLLSTKAAAAIITIAITATPTATYVVAGTFSVFVVEACWVAVGVMYDVEVGFDVGCVFAAG